MRGEEVHKARPRDPAVSHALVVPADAGPDVNKTRGGQAWAKQKTD